MRWEWSTLTMIMTIEIIIKCSSVRVRCRRQVEWTKSNVGLLVGFRCEYGAAATAKESRLVMTLYIANSTWSVPNNKTTRRTRVYPFHSSVRSTILYYIYITIHLISSWKQSIGACGKSLKHKLFFHPHCRRKLTRLLRFRNWAHFRRDFWLLSYYYISYIICT